MSETAGVADDTSAAGPEKTREEDARVSRWTRSGVGLLVVSALLWVPLPMLPLLPLSIAAKAALGGALVVVAEIAFWAGAALAGPEAVRRARLRLRTAFGRGH